MRKAILAAALLLATTARAEQKNVHILTGLTDNQLIDVMNFMRSSLGVHCDFCHVVKEKTGWDFPDDSKENKRTARRMIQMVAQINEQNFENHPEVSCNTCHRGSQRPVSTPILPQPVPPFPTPIRQRPTNLPTRDAVVQKYATAIGDATRLNLPRTFRGSVSHPTASRLRSKDRWLGEGTRHRTDAVRTDRAGLRRHRGLDQDQQGHQGDGTIGARRLSSSDRGL